MNHFIYRKLSKDLQNLARLIPLRWGNIQNDLTDRSINMFQIATFDDLEIAIKGLSTSNQDYFRRRWYLWKCAQCDEYLFYKNPLVRRNSNKKDQTYDIEFFGNKELRFDIKGTVIPKDLRTEKINFNAKFIQILLEFYYYKQSTGVRNNYQNRLFIVHHSFYQPNREMYLRAHWQIKEIVFTKYIQYLNDSPKLLEFKGLKTDLIFIIENENLDISFKFASQLVYS